METVTKLEKCEVCDKIQAKYTCPKCEVRTCSLACCRVHKKDLDCNGIRDKTKFIPLNKFTDLDLISEKDDDEVNKQILSDKLQFYRGAGLSGLEILLKAEKVEKSSSRFYKLDPTSSLQKNLSNKIIIEYPTLHVVFKDHIDMYEIVDSDDEDAKDLIEQPTQSHGNKRKRRQQDSKNSDKRPVNYLFHHESSDSEEEINKNNDGHFSLSSIPDYYEFVKT
ncbi:hypothetical protein G9C98_007540 [Cotesia typhae]|uniref:Box C/D snoRNA protein 1 n=1 Tax=Cotesia typhae TaxID=2053667 RepID=A0A8J5R8Y9_9HYME|nr:hypothetical protein G9C98_007540 [Cotesia typhae]